MAYVILLVLLVLNGVFALAEIAIVSARRARLEHAAGRGDKRAAAALLLVHNPTRLLSTTQAGITLITIFAGAYGERAISADLELAIRAWGLPGRWNDIAALVITVALISYVTLVIGELVPKRLALTAPEWWARLLARPMAAISWFGSPLIKVLSVSTDVVVKLFPMRVVAESDVSEDEIRALIRRGTREGVFEQAEQEIVDRVFRFADLKVRSLMVPRNDIEWLDATASAERVRVAVATSPHSHFPVCKAGLENLIGVVHVKDLVKHGLVAGGGIDLTALAQPPVYVPEGATAIKVLETFKARATHVAFVVDEYGGIEGLLTLNDLVEAVIGEVIRRGEEEPPMAVRRDETTWTLHGRLPLEELRRELGVDRLPLEDLGPVSTVAGLVMALMGRVPQVGDSVAWADMRLDVQRMSGRRVDRVLLTRPQGMPDDHGANRENPTPEENQ